MRRSEMTLSTGQKTGVEHNEPAHDAIDGRRENATTNSKFWANLPNEGSYDKQRALKAFDDAKRRMKR